MDILDKRTELLRNVIRFQISAEQKVNENICDYIERGHKLINDNINGKWSHFRSEDVNDELSKRGLKRGTQPKRDLTVSTTEANTERKKEAKSKFNMGGVKDSPTREKSPTKREMQDLYKQNRRGLIGLEEEPEDRFSQALGLPKISQEDIYRKYRENDQEALDIMNEHSAFIQNQEQQPRRFDNTKYCLDTFMTGETIGVLDFYESLGCIHWLQNMLDQCMKELIEVHKPINNYRLAALEVRLLDKALSKFSDVKDQENNNVFEYEGKAYIEDEVLVGNPEIMRYLMKEVSASLNSGDPKYINPFLIGKLDLETIKFYKFPSSKGLKSKLKFGRKQTNDDENTDAYNDTKFFTTEEMAMMIQDQTEQDKKQTEKEISADYFKIESQSSRRVNSPKNLYLY